MSSLATQFGQTFSDHPLRKAFMKWQCRVRQMAMRESEGRPDDAIMPAVLLTGQAEPLGHVITVMNKAPGYSVTPELLHMAAKTNDPAQIRDQAIRFLSSAYYQRAEEFSDILTATFPPGSPGAAQIHESGECRLLFDAYAQRFDLTCKVWRLAPHNLLHQATMAHNGLFNPQMPPDTVVLGFEPDWGRSSADPEIR
ncbi:hypothetical protein BXY70_2077 [Roseovarius halotolerans]|uniref:Uncharacterized protein n=1 Tax=Roseovarius halotolerans TaxID=505353 RepID=A0A1X6YWF1_9RHOB|nr:hypothetical protein [Roseovarius halotolerans]RKT32729.1 hypothetical protein BXY70_2077 [Roseovarius halotolerans]SLN33637.1 hypothetical protein ROH8110_01628 [Roseovarius halotolerans]